MKRGFTLVELLVAMFIVSLILGTAFLTYITILKGFGRETSSIETQIETAVGIELLRLDIEHAGYGIGEDQPDLPVDFDIANNSLIVRSVLNNTRLIRDTVTNNPIQWSLVECDGSGLIPVVRAGDNINNLPSSGVGLIFLGASSKNFIGSTTDGTCPSSGIFVAIPYDATVVNGCTTQFCNIITYSLSSSQNLSTCNPNTRNLLRTVGSSPGMPILNCVADIRFTFDIDRNGNGTVDVRDGAFLDVSGTYDLDLNNDGTVTADEVKSGLKGVNVYILLQEGKADKEFSFTNYVACVVAPTDTRFSGQCIVANPTTGVELYLPKNFQSYRWKIVKLSVKPMNL